MTQGIVDPLEVIEIEKQYCHFAILPAGERDHMAQIFMGQEAVGQAGQTVVIRQALDLHA